MIRMTREQAREMFGAADQRSLFDNEKVWTLLVADLLDDSDTRLRTLELLCGESLPVRDGFDVWFESQPLSPRSTERGTSEGNTRLDLAFRKCFGWSDLQFRRLPVDPFASTIGGSTITDLVFYTPAIDNSHRLGSSTWPLSRSSRCGDCVIAVCCRSRRPRID
jgi:hypothetical protein